MLRLIKTDLKRIIKDKLFLITLIIAVVFALMNPLIYKLLTVALGFEGEDMGMLGILISSKQLLFSSFSLSNNFGLMIPVFISIIICKDFSYGTIRNKIICGHSRVKVFFSIFISTCIILIGVILFHALLTFGISSIFFQYQAEPFTSKDFVYLIESILFQLLNYMFISALITLLCMIGKNIGLSIVGYVAIMLISTIVGTILSAGIGLAEFSNLKELVLKILEVLLNINIFNNNTAVIGLVEKYELKDILFLILSPTIWSCLCLGVGILNFNKKDLK